MKTNLTKNEQMVLKAIVETKDDFNEPVIDKRIVRLNEIIKTNGEKREVKTAAKYILENWDNAEINGGLKSFMNDDEMKASQSELHKIAKSRYWELVELAAKEISTKEILLNNAFIKAETTSKASESKREGKVTNTAKKTSRAERKVGDHHPTQPWVWTEYKPGKFDWRSDKKKIKKETKKAKQPKQITTEEFINNAKSKHLSATQAEYLKLLRKGYWIWNNNGHYFFKNEEGKMKQCNIDSLKSLFKKFNIEEIPSCLIR